MPAIDPEKVLSRQPAMETLALAVPMWIDKMYREGWSFDRRYGRAQACAQAIAAHGDSLQFRDKHSAEAFNRLAEGLAIGAFQPGGVSFGTYHWQAQPPPEPDPAPEPDPVTVREEFL